MTPDPAPRTCPRCHTPLRANAPAGLCPGCLLRAGLEDDPSLSDEPSTETGAPHRFGDYELLERIARGGMGIVYKARHVELGRVVALKMIREGELATEAEVHRFHAEARAAARLEHPNIVPVYEVSEHAGRHYFTMKLMEGGNLAARLPTYVGKPREAARLVATVARAVHHGHQRGLLHRDLKPANLLLDADGVPHVADFGVAKTLDQETHLTQTGAVVGTPGYMAPEQARPDGPLTVAVDVYALGVILYELLTGQLPFPDTGRAPSSDVDPTPLRAVNPRLPRDLETICQGCLEKDPARRYGSAAALADELDRYLAGEPLATRPVGRLARAWRWCRRHPVGAALLATVGWFLLVVAGAAITIASAQEADLREDALRVNVRMAQVVANAVTLQLWQYFDSVERAARDPELSSALEARDAAKLETLCRSAFLASRGTRGIPVQHRSAPFERWFLLDASGRAVARWPRPPRDFLGTDFSFRDYFASVLARDKVGQHGAYVSRAFHAEADGLRSFAVAAPVYGAGGALIGVLVTAVSSDSALGSLALADEGGSQRTALLAAPPDRERDKSSLPPGDAYAVIVHEALVHGMEAKLAPAIAHQLSRAVPQAQPVEDQFDLSGLRAAALEGYRDPVSNDPGPWLAAFAPVGRTGFAVIVQTKENAALKVNALLARRIVGWTLPFLLGAALLWLAPWRARRAARSGG